MDAKVSTVAREDGLSCAPMDWSLAARNPLFRKLIEYKTRRVRPAIAIYFITYISISIFAGFAPNLMSVKLIGAFSLGYALILLTYIVAWAVALWYVRAARVEFDPLKQEAIQSIKREGSIR